MRDNRPLTNELCHYDCKNCKNKSSCENCEDYCYECKENCEYSGRQMHFFNPPWAGVKEDCDYPGECTDCEKKYQKKY